VAANNDSVDGADKYGALEFEAMDHKKSPQMRRQLLLDISVALVLAGMVVHSAFAAKKTPKGRAASLKQILTAPSLDKKGLLCVKLRRAPLSATEIMMVLKFEKEDSIAAMVVGMAFEGGKLTGAEAVRILRAMTARKTLADKAAVIAAWSPVAGEIMNKLVASTPQDRVIAARMVAVYAYAMSAAQERDRFKSGASGSARRTKRGAKAGRGKGAARKRRADWFGRVDLKDTVAKLLTNRSAEIRELAILAAAYAKIDDLAETVEGVKVPAGTAGAGVEGARLFYLARIGRALAAKTLRATLGARVRPELKYLKSSPALNSYQIRGNAIIYACQAVAASGDSTCLDVLHKLLVHRDLRIQIEAARAVAAAGSHESVEPLLTRLKASRLTWPAKVAVLSALGAIPDIKSVEPLLLQLKAEKGRFRQDVAYALASINCGKHGDDPAKWRSWWDANRKTFKPNDAATADWRREHRVQDIKVRALTDFYGVGIFSDRIVFVLDTSASMRGDKIVSLKETMSQTLSHMPDSMKFNIVDFGGIIRVMNSGGLMSGLLSETAASQIGHMDLSLGTRTFDAMEVAADLPDLDTVMYLSDGAPVAGQFQAWGSITRSFDLYLRYRPVSIHCIYYSKEGKAAGVKTIKASADSYKGIPGGMKRLVDHHTGQLFLPARGGDEAVEL
jgi:hypothetical protein